MKKRKNKRKNKRKRILKQAIRVLVSLLITSGLLGIMLQFAYENRKTKPSAWINIDSIEKIDDFGIKIPNEIYLESNNTISNIYEDSLIINLCIKNASDNEIMVNDLKIELNYYQCDFPIISISDYIEDEYFKIDISNSSDQEITEMNIELYDNDNILADVFGKDLNYGIENLKGNEKRTIVCFNLNDIKNKHTISWTLKPYIIIKDLNNNILKIELDWYSLNKMEHNNYMPASPCLAPKYLYNISPDIVINNDEVKLNEIKEIIPSHEMLDLELLIVSKYSCAFNMKVLYRIDNKEYSEYMGNFVIYNPTNSVNGYEYRDEYIEVK